MSMRRNAALGTALILIAGATAASANVPVTEVASDGFTNPTSQHRTIVEPDTFAVGSTIVSAFQVGRFFNGGGSDIGFATSTDNGATWTNGVMPGLTAQVDPTSQFQRASDASVAFDARHNVWMVSSIPLLPNTAVPLIAVNRSTDGGLTWGNPVFLPQPATKVVDLDKNWTACDNTPTSPFYGNCYTEFDNFGQGDVEYMSTSSDGGVTWSVPIDTAGHDKGLGGQPVVQPNGTVVVPFESLNGAISSFVSTNGGASWSHAVKVAGIRFHGVAGNLRTSPLPSAEIGGDGTVYVAWEDCRFRVKCSSNDIVFSTSHDGLSWSAPARIPIDAASSTVDHFIPGLAVDRATSGSHTHLALTYYFYPNANCTTTTCRLTVGYISSPDGGAHWGAAQQLAGPMSLTDIAQTSQGPMVGDYISTSFMGSGQALAAFAVGLPHAVDGPFDEALYVPSSPLGVASAADAVNAASTAGVVAPITGIGTGETHHDLKQE
jgi:hypothetical protein